MNIITIFYIINITLLLLHEIESAFQKEWELLKLPGKITGFLFLHVPIILLLLYGLVKTMDGSLLGLIFGILAGVGGLMPFIIHKIFFKNDTFFNLLISNIIIYLNAIFGIILIILCVIFYLNELS
ncbi:MAG: DUF6713 family protein [Candidatus Uhrbacteria bacterium]